MVRLACHLHSDWSYDGQWSLARLAAVFPGRGYRVLMMTEHDLGFTPARWREYRSACASVSSDHVLVVPGMEYSDAANTVHLLVWGVEDFLGEGQPTGQVLERVRAAHGVAVLAHPSRRAAWQSFDPAWSERLAGIEVWNRKTDGWAPSPQAWPLLRQPGVQPFVGLDFHNDRQRFPLAMELEASWPLGEAEILKRLGAGQGRPTVFRRPLGRFQQPVWAGTLRWAEVCRRTLAAGWRKLRR